MRLARHAPTRRRRVPLPSDWGFGVSVCIATMAQQRQLFVVVTDQLISVGDEVTIDHAMVKLDLINQPKNPSPLWAVAWSGSDITAIPPIIRSAQNEFASDERGSPPLTAARVAEVLSKAYQAQTRLRISAEVLSQYDLDTASFATEGHAFFRDQFSAVLQQIQQVKLGATLLVCGFDGGKEATLFTIGDRGAVDYYDKIGFWVIGSGQSLALSALALRQHNREKSLAEAICNACEAKFCAELAGGVGRHTTAVVIGKSIDYWVRVVPSEVVERIRTEIHGAGLRPPIPQAALEAAQKWSGIPFTPPPSQANQQSRKSPKRGRKRQLPSQE